MHHRTHPLEQAAPLLNMGRHTPAARQMPHPRNPQGVTHEPS